MEAVRLTLKVAFSCFDKNSGCAETWQKVITAVRYDMMSEYDCVRVLAIVLQRNGGRG